MVRERETYLGDLGSIDKKTHFPKRYISHMEAEIFSWVSDVYLDGTAITLILLC
jgi:hypothetical protein